MTRGTQWPRTGSLGPLEKGLRVRHRGVECVRAWGAPTRDRKGSRTAERELKSKASVHVC